MSNPKLLSKMFKEKEKPSFFYTNLTIIFGILRIIFVIIQSSYLSPDEFVPNLEAFAGNHLSSYVNFPNNVDQFQARPFNYETNLNPSTYENFEADLNTSPTITIDYIFFGWSYQILKRMDDLLQKMSWSIVTPYTLLLTPRLVMCLWSFLIDYVLYKICIMTGNIYQPKLAILGSSYSMLAYSSRTLASTKEAILFAGLLYFIGESLTLSNIAAKNPLLNLKALRSSKKILAQRKRIQEPASHNVIPICVLVVLGIFNRWTFLLLSITPLGYWLCRGLKTKFCIDGCKTIKCIKRSMMMVTLLTVITIIMVVVDSLVYGYCKMEDILSRNFSNCKFFVSPVYKLMEMVSKDRVVLYGLDRQLGTFLGLGIMLVHVLKLFPCLGFCNVTKKNKLARKTTPTLRQSMEHFMNMVSLMSASLLMLLAQPTSVDLLPIILPFVYVTADQIKAPPTRPPIHHHPSHHHHHHHHSDHLSMSVNDPAAAAANADDNSDGPLPHRYLFVLWLCINLSVAACVAVLHEGGVLAAAKHLALEHRATATASDTYNPVVFHIVTSHVYPLPHVLLQQRANLCAAFVENHGRLPLTALIERLLALRYEAYVSGRPYRLYLLLAGGKHAELMATLERSTAAVRVRLTRVFGPHLPSDTMPASIDEILGTVRSLSKNITHCWSSPESESCNELNMSDLFQTLIRKMHLNLYTIDP